MKALLGGSFDPIHQGHLALAEAIVDVFGADDVYLVPAYRNPLKDRSSAPAEDRLAMVQLAIDALRRTDVHVLPWELERAGPSFTVDTLERFAEEFPGPRALVLGNEVFERFAEWRRPKDILKMAELWILARTVEEDAAVVTFRRSLLPLGIESVRLDAHTFQLGDLSTARWLETETPQVSSTDLRTALATTNRNDQRAVPSGLPTSVWDWIKKRSLYAVTEE